MNMHNFIIKNCVYLLLAAINVVLLSSSSRYCCMAFVPSYPNILNRGRIDVPSSSSSFHPPSSFASTGTLRRRTTHPIIQLNASLSPTVNVALISSSISILMGYHINLYYKEKNSDKTTWRQYQAQIRQDWAKHVRDTEGWLYAIQSLRNAMVARE